MLVQLLAWLVIAYFLLKYTIVYGIVAIFSLGKYNIGGCKNSLGKKVLVIIGVGAVAFIWYQMCLHFPYEFVPKTQEVIKTVS